MIAVVRLIHKYIWKNKGRSLFIGLSILISAALITSLTLTIDDFKKENTKSFMDNYGGNYDGYITTTDAEYLKNIDNMSIIEDKSFVILLTDAIPISEVIPINKYKLNNQSQFINFIGFDKNATAIFNFKLLEGRYPKSKNEILLQDCILNSMNNIPKIGDKLKLTYIVKMNNKKEDINTEDEFSFIEDEFTLVGTFKHTEKSAGSQKVAIAFVTNDYARDVFTNKAGYENNKIKYDCYIRVKEGISEKQAKDILSEKNVDVSLDYMFVRQRYLKGIRFWNTMEIILFIIISAASIVILYNIFNASTMIRTSETGMLKALGMTPKQIKAMIVGEGLVIGIVFIFLGIVAGSFSYEVTMALIRGQDFSYNLLDIPQKSIVMSYIFGIISILIGNMSSVRKISEISSIEAINCTNYLDTNNVRNNNDKELGGTTKKFLQDMARCNIKRNKSRFIITTGSIVISIVLFMLVNYILNCQNPAYGFEKKFGADFIVEDFESNKKDQFGEKGINRIQKIDGIKNVSSKALIFGCINVSNCRDKVTGEGIKNIEQKYSSLGRNMTEYKEKGYYYLATSQTVYDRTGIEKLKNSVKEGKIDLDSMEKDPVCILVQNMTYHNLTKFKVGDKIWVSQGYSKIKNGKLNTENEVQFTVGAILKNDGYIPNDESIYTELIMSDKVSKKYFDRRRYLKKEISVDIDNSSDYDVVKKELTKIISKNPSLELKGYKEELVKVKELHFKLNTFLYGFVIIIAVASIANIFSIMIMNIVLRKKEFSMLRAVGMSNGEIGKLIMNEAFIYGGVGGVIGLPLGTILTYLIFILLRKNFMAGMIWYFPLQTIAALVGVIMLVCLLASLCSWKKLFKDNIIDSVRAIE